MSARLITRIVNDSDANALNAKVYWNTEWEEYQVRYWNPDGVCQIDSDYFTDDRDDAIDTAKLVCGVET